MKLQWRKYSSYCASRQGHTCFLIMQTSYRHHHPMSSQTMSSSAAQVCLQGLESQLFIVSLEALPPWVWLSRFQFVDLFIFFPQSLQHGSSDTETNKIPIILHLDIFSGPRLQRLIISHFSPHHRFNVKTQNILKKKKNTNFKQINVNVIYRYSQWWWQKLKGLLEYIVVRQQLYHTCSYV